MHIQKWEMGLVIGIMALVGGVLGWVVGYIWHPTEEAQEQKLYSPAEYNDQQITVFGRYQTAEEKMYDELRDLMSRMEYGEFHVVVDEDGKSTIDVIIKLRPPIESITEIIPQEQTYRFQFNADSAQSWLDSLYNLDGNKIIYMSDNNE